MRDQQEEGGEKESHENKYDKDIVHACLKNVINSLLYTINISNKIKRI